MKQKAEIRSYKVRPLSTAMREKVERCYTESLELADRELHCPHCGNYIMTLYSDAAGHLRHTCKNCKTETVFNLGCFRKSRRFACRRFR